MSLEVTRALFEEKVYSEYFVRGIKFINGKQFAEVRNTKTKAELFKSNDGRHYVDDGIEAMWFGWCLSLEETTTALQELVELKDMKEQIDAYPGKVHTLDKNREHDAIVADYHRRKPLAWAAARSFLGDV